MNDVDNLETRIFLSREALEFLTNIDDLNRLQNAGIDIRPDVFGKLQHSILTGSHALNDDEVCYLLDAGKKVEQYSEWFESQNRSGIHPEIDLDLFLLSGDIRAPKEVNKSLIFDLKCNFLSSDMTPSEFIRGSKQVLSR